MEKIKIKTTKANLTHFSKEDYSIPLMLSEFIDNSISSWEKDKTRSDNEDLLIEITFHSYLKKFSNSNETQKKFVIIIKDNANGISYDDMKNKAAPFYDSTNKGKEDLNQHGIGLKSAIGWFGSDATIYSKTLKEEKINSLKINTSDFKDEDEWFLELNNDLEFNKDVVNNPGTTIRIENIHTAEQKFDELNNENIQNLLSFLGWKYKYYLNEKVKIKIVYKNSDSNFETKYYYVAPFTIRPWNIKDFYGVIYKKLKNRVNESEFEDKYNICKRKFEDKIEKLINESSKTSSKFEICYKILNNKDVVVTKEIEIENKKYHITVGIISSNSIKYNVGFFGENVNKNFDFAKINYKYNFDNLQGVGAFHHNRGIHIGPNLEKQKTKSILGKISNTISFASNRKTINGKSTPIRLFGEIFLNDIKTEINKAKFQWSYHFNVILNDCLKKIWEEDFQEILDFIIEAEDFEKSSKKISESDIQKSSLQISEKTNDSLSQIEHSYNENNNHEWIYKSKFKNKEYTFKLIEEAIDKKPFYCKQNNETDFTINYDYDHPIWRPSNQNTALGNRVLSHPIIVTLALAQWLIEEKNQNSLSSTKFEFDLFDMIDEIIKDWKIEDNE